MSFAKPYSKWIQDRMEYVPRETRQFCGDIGGLRLLNVGCGDMMADLGLLSLGVEHITGIDILERDWDVIEHAASEVEKAGFAAPPGYRSKLTYQTYDGRHFSFPNASFDLVICWGAFEHIANVPAVLREMKRVVRPDVGRIFTVTYPWYHSYTGSHLTDYIEEPFFHLTRPDDWVYSKLEEYVKNHPEIAGQHRPFPGKYGCSMHEFILEIMWNEYRNLNGYSARLFLAAATEAGLLVERMQGHLEQPCGKTPPPFVNPVDVYTAGTTALFRPIQGA